MTRPNCMSLCCAGIYLLLIACGCPQPADDPDTSSGAGASLSEAAGPSDTKRPVLPADFEPLRPQQDPQSASPMPQAAPIAPVESASPSSPAAHEPAATESVQTVVGETSLKAAERSPEPLLEDWKRPAVAIVLTGEQHGHLEPCGCSERQSGGHARRADFVRQLEARGWPITGFELGGTLKRIRRQSEMKLEVTRDNLDEMGYAGFGLGPSELKLGVYKLFESFSRTRANERFDVPYLSANVTFFGTRDVGTPLEFRMVEVDGVRIAATSIIGGTFREDLFPGGNAPSPDELRVDPVDEALPVVIEKMQAALAEAGGDKNQSVMLLLAYTKPDESAKLAEQYPMFDLIVTAGSPEDPRGDAEEVGNTLILKTGEKGKHAGLVGVYPDAEQRFRFTTVELDRFRFGHDSQVDERMAQYQQLLKDENLIATESPVRHDFGAGYTFVGSQKCGECHDAEFEIWENTPHAHAYESLTVEWAQAHEDPGMAARVRVDRVYDPECINCHTTGWDPQAVLRYEGGFTGLEKTPYLVAVGCENCHGPASEHVKLEESGAADALLNAERKKLHLSTATAEVQLCIKCHDGENSPDFDFKTYWPQIEH